MESRGGRVRLARLELNLPSGKKQVVSTMKNLWDVLEKVLHSGLTLASSKQDLGETLNRNKCFDTAEAY